SGTLNASTTTFSAVENLTGNAGNDTFTFEDSGSLSGTVKGEGGTNDTVNGNASANTFNITASGAGGSSSLVNAFQGIETINGNGNDDVFNFSSGSVVTANGNDGNDQFNFSGGSATTVSGGAGTDTLTGDDTSRTFEVTGGSISGGASGNVSSIVS